LKSVLESSTGIDLCWFFDDLVKTTKKIDYKICNIKSINDSSNLNIKTYEVKIKNKGKINAPFEVSALHNDSVFSKKWFDGFPGKKSIRVSFGDFDKLLINSDNDCPEFNRKNNFIRTKGLFKKIKPLKIHLLPAVDDPLLTQISFTPLIGFNLNNGFMAGFATYNNPIPQKKFSYLFLPLYGTSNNDLAGYSRVGLTLLPENTHLQLIWIGASYSRYSYSQDPFNLNFNKLAPEILIKFKNTNYRSPIISYLRLRNVNVFKDIARYASSNNENTTYKDNSNYYVNELKYSFANNRKINPFNFNIIAEQSDRFFKTSIETSYRISYDSPRKGLDIRAFWGDFLYLHKPITEDFRFNMSGKSGYKDYLFDNYYIGRTNTNDLFSQQFCENDGAFKVYTPIGQTWKWLFAMNFKTSLPFKFPVKLFADIATFPDKSAIYDSNYPMFFDAGIQLSIINNIFDIFFPIIMSSEIKNVNKLNKISYLQSIRFTFALEKFDPFKKLRDIR
ncbi:MAG: hypothetical protein HGB12_16370, partial [Bacteroidetes bacterium]|nr:hypothetical protein [Bacteroidota bacterium]